MDLWEIRQGDCLTLLRQMPADSVHCVVTSPPSLALPNESIQSAAGHPEIFAPGNILIGKGEVGDSTDCPMLIGKVTITDNLGSVLMTLLLEFAEAQHQLGLPTLYSQEWQQCSQCLFGSEVAYAPAVQRTPVVAVWLFGVQRAAKQRGQQFHAGTVHHANLNGCMVARRSSALAPVRPGFFDTDIRFPINKAGAVGEFSLKHKEPSK